MKKLDRYILINMLRISLISMGLITVMLLVIDLFINFQSYMNFTRLQTASLLCLRIPSYISLVAGPAVLFSTTYFVSSLYSNNEFISMLSAGISYRRIIRAIIFLSFFYTVFFFIFNETVKNRCDMKYDYAYAEYQNPGRANYENNNRNITLTDSDNNITIRAYRYIDKDMKLENLYLILFDENGKLSQKIYANTASWDESADIWRLNDVNVFEYNKKDMVISPRHEEKCTITSFTLAPSFFRSKGEDIRTMKLHDTKEYLDSIKKINPSSYYEKITEFYTRLSQSIIILVMMIVSLSMNLKNHRNAMMFSLISSLALATVYYGLNLITTQLAKKGMLNPLFAVLFPIVIILTVSFYLMRRIST